MLDRPVPDEIPVRVTDTVTAGVITPTYPVLEYPHTPEGGDAIAGGFVYRGTRIPALRGKFVFGDISTGKIWYANAIELFAADDGDPGTVAARHGVEVRWTAPSSNDPRVYPTMFPVVLTAFLARGGTDPDLPGTATISGSGRADIRFAVDASGELYILSKPDGMIRAVTAAN
jgi:hypothetical protein